MLEIATAPDSRTGSTLRLFDPLDWIHAITAHIPDRGRHCVRYYGAVANRAQSPKISKQQTPPAADPGASVQTPPEFVQRRRASWARQIEKIFEVDPLLLFTAKGRMKQLMEAIPVRIILNDRTALLGAARFASLKASR